MTAATRQLQQHFNTMTQRLPTLLIGSRLIICLIFATVTLHLVASSADEVSSSSSLRHLRRLTQTPAPTFTDNSLALPSLSSFVDAASCPAPYLTDSGFDSPCYWAETLTMFAAQQQYTVRGTPRMRGNWSQLVSERAAVADGTSVCNNAMIYPLYSFPHATAPAATVTSACTVVVDPVNGNDISGTGLLSAPVASIQQALTMTRTCTPQNSATILLRTGVYYIINPIQLTSADNNLNIMGYPNDDPVITGTALLTNLQWNSVSHMSGVYTTSLPSSINTSPLLLNELYLIDGSRLIRARYPNGDEYNINDIMLNNNNIAGTNWMFNAFTYINNTIQYSSSVNTVYQAFVRDGSYYNTYAMSYGGPAEVFINNQNYWAATSPEGGVQFSVPSEITYANTFGHLINWTDYQDAYLHMSQSSGWGVLQFHISQINLQDQTLSFDVGGYQQARQSGLGAASFVENVLEELDAVHEWYYSRSSNLLYYMPPTGTLPPTSLEISQTPTMIEITGGSFITISGITFQHSSNVFMGPHMAGGGGDWATSLNGTIVISNGINNTIQHSLFTNTGSPHIVVLLASHNNHILHNEFTNSAEGAIVVAGQLLGYDATQEHTQPWNTTIRNNLFFNLGRIQKQSGALINTLSYQTIFEYNIISTTPRSGINIQDGFGGGHSIRYNAFLDTSRETLDVGPLNFWNRVPYYTAINPSNPSWDTAWIDVSYNLIINDNNAQYGLDADDGSNHINDHNNILINTYAKQFESYTVNHYNNFYFNGEYCIEVYAQGNLNYFFNNTCYYTIQSSNTGYYIGYNNSYYTNTLPSTYEISSRYTLTSGLIYPYLRFAISDLLNLTCLSSCHLYTNITLQCIDHSKTFFNGPYYIQPLVPVINNIIHNQQTSNTTTITITSLYSPEYIYYTIDNNPTINILIPTITSSSSTSGTNIPITTYTGIATISSLPLTYGIINTLSIFASNEYGNSSINTYQIGLISSSQTLWFGGMYDTFSNPNNAVTGIHGCPSGYQVQELTNNAARYNDIAYYCYKYASITQTPDFSFGGFYGSGYNDTTGQTIYYNNPYTNTQSCPTNYYPGNVLGFSGQNYLIIYCIKSYQPGDYVNNFGGIYSFALDTSPGNVTSYVNPATNSMSCSSGYNVAQFHGAGNVDFPAYSCYGPPSTTLPTGPLAVSSSSSSLSVPSTVSSSGVPAGTQVVTNSVQSGNVCVYLSGNVGASPWSGIGSAGWSAIIQFTFNYTTNSITPVATPGYGSYAVMQGINSGSVKIWSAYQSSYTGTQPVVSTNIIGLSSTTASGSSNILYTSTTAPKPLDANGVGLLLAAGIEFPGVAQTNVADFVNVYYSRNLLTGAYALHSNAFGAVSPTNTSFLTDIPQFPSVYAPPAGSDLSSASGCQSALASNGFNVPTAVSAPAQAAALSNIWFNYSVTDGATWRVNTTLHLIVVQASTVDTYGISTTVVQVVGGQRIYAYKSGGVWSSSTSSVSGGSCYTSNQNFYSSTSQYPYVDASGIQYNVRPAQPIVGLPQSGIKRLSFTIYSDTSTATGRLTEAPLATSSKPQANLQWVAFNTI